MSEKNMITVYQIQLTGDITNTCGSVIVETDLMTFDRDRAHSRLSELREELQGEVDESESEDDDIFMYRGFDFSGVPSWDVVETVLELPQ